MPSLTFPTTIGPCQLIWESDILRSLQLLANDQPQSIAAEMPPPPWITSLSRRVAKHLTGESEDFSDTPFNFDQVTPFQAEVYRTALRVKSGETRTYGWLAAQIKRPPGASRAVGTALGKNPWLLLVPCHRFISATGKLTGFSAPGGIATKRHLLSIEGAELTFS